MDSVKSTTNESKGAGRRGKSGVDGVIPAWNCMCMETEWEQHGAAGCQISSVYWRGRDGHEPQRSYASKEGGRGPSHVDWRCHVLPSTSLSHFSGFIRGPQIPRQRLSFYFFPNFFVFIWPKFIFPSTPCGSLDFDSYTWMIGSKA